MAADELDDFDLDEDLDLDENDPTGVEGETANQPEFGEEDEEEDLDLDDDEEEDLTEEEILRRAMEDELEEAEGQ